MAERGNQEERGSEDTAGGGGGSRPPELSSAPSHGTKRHLPRGIVIQLTGTEGEWNSLDDGELIFSLEQDEDYPSISLSKERELSTQDQAGFHVPLSPSSPGSLGTCSTTGTSFLSPGSPSQTQRPLSSLVKSLSTELELKEGSTLRPKPLLSLVKSISTELCRSEPEVSQSKSDSRLNLHLWKQLTQPRTRSNGDSRTAPPSPSSLSPCGEAVKGGFFKMELEDTKRKFSEAMQEPLSNMFSKIMREESVGSPKHQSKSQLTQQASTQSAKSLGREGSADTATNSESQRPDADVLPVFDYPSVRRPRSFCPVHQDKQHRDQDLDLCADGDTVQVSAAEIQRPPAGAEDPAALLVSPSPLPLPPPLPHWSLFCVAVLSYGYLTLPLGPYASGLALGLALGFFLGLLLIRLGSSTRRGSDPACRPPLSLLGEQIWADGAVSAEPEVLKGWMNEIQEYDPETFHPALTHSVFATLEGSCLRLDSPRTNISRRAAFDQRLPEHDFIKTRCFQLMKSKVFLLPSLLACKRAWNPKYPICIQLDVGGGEAPPSAPLTDWDQADEAGGEQATTSPTQTSSRRIQDPPAALYLFGRTGREKEEWFRHFLFASVTVERDDTHTHGRCVSAWGDPAQSVGTSVNVPPSRVGSSEEEAACTPPQPDSQSSACTLLDYPGYMAHLLAAEEPSPLSSPGAAGTDSPTARASSALTQCTCEVREDSGRSQVAWANALIGRVFWDFLGEKHWADVVSRKVQKKLSKIRLPYFMNELTVTELDMGSCMPQITAASRPQVNHRGLWVELQLVYTGALQMTLQTKFNLSKLGKEAGQDADSVTDTGSPCCRPVLSVLADSDEESSSAGSSEEEELLPSEPQGATGGEKGSAPAPEGTGSGRTGKKILRFVDKIAKSKYFQRATETEFIKKKFEEMSNTPLLLTVEVKELSGPLVVNVPPPPTDRIWYSFCVPPKLDLRVRPKLGEREVTFCHVTEWIEKKLQDEFQKVFVLPNMDDIHIPLMHAGTDGSGASQRLDSQCQHSQNSSSESIERIQPELSESDSSV
ncbi:testis-expressed protein 2 [Genypterus blacodes]|uniref:testis-expressed protein 2 n=1 Tax=Genypterus blacodes TaxID=154954 RepID=UPI003F76CD16